MYANELAGRLELNREDESVVGQLNRGVPAVERPL
jgi:hypothetical protein